MANLRDQGEARNAVTKVCPPQGKLARAFSNFPKNAIIFKINKIENTTNITENKVHHFLAYHFSK